MEKTMELYTKKDIDDMSLIYFLLKEKGMTISGAKKKIKENRSDVIKNHEIIDKLKEIRQQLMSIIKEME